MIHILYKRSLVFAALTASMLVILSCDSGNTPTNSTAKNPAGRLYVLNQSDASLYIYDTQTFKRLDSIPTVVERPHYLEFSPTGDFYYIVTLEQTGRIAKFNAVTNAFVDSVTVPPAVQPSAIVITPDGLTGYVCNFSLPGRRTQINKYDLTNMENIGSFPAGVTTHDLKMTSDGSVIVACNRYGDNLTLLYPGADTVTFVSIDPDSLYADDSNKYGPFGVVIDNKDSLAYIACMDALQVRVLDIKAREIVDSINIPVDSAFIYGPTLLAISPDDKTVYLTTRGGNSLVAFDAVTMTVLADIPLNTPYPFGVDISADGSQVYVSCVGEPTTNGAVQVIDAKTLSGVTTLQVGTESFGLRWRPISP
jgi:YVTN family beta-propeller protein